MAFANVGYPLSTYQKFLCVLTLDVSDSMSGAPIQALNQGLQDFYQEIQQDSLIASSLEIALVTFSDDAKLVQAPALADEFMMPTIQSGGSTKLTDGVRLAMKVVEERKQYYKQTMQPYYRPWIVLLTDGAPDGGQDVNGLARDIQSEMNAKAFEFFAIGVHGADMNMLSKISNPQKPPLPLQGLKFTAFFLWLSKSLAIITSSHQTKSFQLASPAGWMAGYTA